eukprot:scaffold134486_cov38-Attheya_sp.AAC.1
MEMLLRALRNFCCRRFGKLGPPANRSSRMANIFCVENIRANLTSVYGVSYPIAAEDEAAAKL